MVCRPTQKEAEDYYRHAVLDNADWGAVEQMMALKNITRQTVTAEVFAQQQQYFAGKGIGGYPFIGTPDRVAEELANISQRRHARHRGVVRQLSQRDAVFLRRGAAAAGAAGGAAAALIGEEIMAQSILSRSTPRSGDPGPH